MGNKILVFDKLAFDPQANQFFQLILIDGGTSYNMYIKDVAAPTNPSLASNVSSSGAVPVIAPSGGGDVVGLGTTGNLMLWTDGPNSVAGDALLTQSGGNITLPSGNFILTSGTIGFPSNVRQTFSPGATVPGLNIGSFAGDPSTPANGDIWYDSTGNLMRARINGATISLGNGTVTGSGTTNKLPKWSNGAGGVLTNSSFDESVVPGVVGSHFLINTNASIGTLGGVIFTTGADTVVAISGVLDSSIRFAFGFANSSRPALKNTGSGATTLLQCRLGDDSGDAPFSCGGITLPTAGNGILIKEGSNATMGTGTLNGATEVTVSTTKVTANSRIFLSIQVPGGTPLGVIYVSSRSAGVSFGVKGAATDTSTFAWWIAEPAP